MSNSWWCAVPNYIVQLFRNSVDRLVNSNFFTAHCCNCWTCFSRYEPTPLTPTLQLQTPSVQHWHLPSLRFLLGVNKMQFYKIKTFTLGHHAIVMVKLMQYASAKADPGRWNLSFYFILSSNGILHLHQVFKIVSITLRRIAL